METHETLVISSESIDAAGRLVGWGAVRVPPPDIVPGSFTAAAVRRAVGLIEADIGRCEKASDNQSSALHGFCIEALALDSELGASFNGVLP